jgi:hypothetical protein
MKLLICSLFYITTSIGLNAQFNGISNEYSLGTFAGETPQGAVKLSDGSLFISSSQAVIGGDKTAPNYGSSDFWLVKMDANRTIIWDKTYGGSEYEGGPMLVEFGNGLLLAGISNSPVSGNKTVGTKGDNDYYVLKLDLDGNIQWQKSYGGSSLENISKITVINNNRVLLSGVSYSNISGDKSQNSFGSGDSWLIMIDSLGNRIWDKTYGGSESDGANTALFDPVNNCIFVVNSSESPVSGNKTTPFYGAEESLQDAWILKLDLSGNILSQTSRGGLENDELVSMVLDNNQVVYMVGYSSSGISGNKTSENYGWNDVWVVKMDKDLTILMDKNYGSYEVDAASMVYMGPNNQLLLVGSSNSLASKDKTENGSGEWDIWLLSIDEFGKKLWDKSLGGDKSEDGYFIVGNDPQNLTVVGYSYSGISGDKTTASKGQTDIWMFDINTTLGIPEFHTDENIVVYTSPQTGIVSFDLSKINTAVSISVYDNMGRKLDEIQSNSSEIVSWKGAVHNQVVFYTIEGQGLQTSGKVMKY